MKVLRTTIFPRPVKGAAPMTTIVRDIDMTEPLENVRDGAEALDRSALVISDLFDLPDGTEILQATLEAERRIRKDAEKHMATLFHWDAMACEATVRGSIISPTIPAPLGEEDVGCTLEALAKHPGYKGQSVVVICEDWTILVMRDGVVLPLGPNARQILEGAQEKIISAENVGPKDVALMHEIDQVFAHGRRP